MFSDVFAEKQNNNYCQICSIFGSLHNHVSGTSEHTVSPVSITLLSVNITKTNTENTFFVASLTQTVSRGVHNPNCELWEVSLEVKSGLRCVFHAERSVRSHTLRTCVKLPGLATRIQETWAVFLKNKALLFIKR